MPGGQRVEPGVQVGAADAHGRAACHARLQQAVAYLGADDLGRHPGKGLGLGHAQQGAVGDGDVGLLLGVVRFGRGCVLLLCHDDVYASRDSAPQRVRGVLHRHGCGAWIGNGVLDRFLEDESLFGEFLRTPVSEGGVESLVVEPPHIVVEVGA